MTTPKPPTLVHGTCHPRFQPVRDAFRRNFTHHGEIGAALAIYHHGQLVVDLWGGVAEPHTGKPWNHDTVTYLFSTTKGITATCANLLVQQGLLDLDTPVAHYWPEFAHAGKQHIPVRWLLTHQAGLPHLAHPISLDEALDWYPMIEALAAQPPLWPPGRGHGYHAQTFGWLVGEIIRRITGHTPGHFFNTHIAEPFGLDLWIGLPKQHHHRFAPIIEPLTGTTGPAPSPITVTDPPIDPNDPRVHAAEIPSSNAIGTAQSLAYLYATLISDDQPILTTDTLASATTEQVNGHDRTLNRPTRYGIGYSLPSTTFPLYGPRSFGHGGKGGSLGLADPYHHIAFGYLMNQMHPPYTTDTRTTNLTRALHQSLPARRA